MLGVLLSGGTEAERQELGGKTRRQEDARRRKDYFGTKSITFNTSTQVGTLKAPAETITASKLYQHIAP
jgi:hypothetical protein